MFKYFILTLFLSLLYCNNITSDFLQDKDMKDPLIKYYEPLFLINDSINHYSIFHFFEYSLLSFIKIVKLWHFWIISIFWEILELFLPYDWARESWSNKFFDLGFNFSGFYLTRKLLKKKITI